VLLAALLLVGCVQQQFNSSEQRASQQQAWKSNKFVRLSHCFTCLLAVPSAWKVFPSFVV